MNQLNRRKFLKRLMIAGGISWLSYIKSKAVASSMQLRPNIIIVHVDNLGWADVAYNAVHDYYETPNINALKNSGMSFTNGYAACAVCSPTRAALMTGRYPPRTGITNWISTNLNTNPQGYEDKGNYLTPKNYSFLEPAEITIAELLKTAGYLTNHVGKWHLGGGTAGRYYPESQGFGTNMGGCEKGNVSGNYFEPYGLPNMPDDDPLENTYLTDRENREAIKVMRAAVSQSKPFFLHMAHYAVHAPVKARSDYLAYFQSKPKPIGWEHLRADYAAMIYSVDEAVGGLMSEINNLGIRNNTLFIFTSDNGGYLPSTDNTPLRSGMGYPYEGGIREPWIFSWPGVIPAASECHVPICSIDFMPTICDLLNIRLPAGVEIDGCSLLPLLTQTADLYPRDLFWHYPHYAGGVYAAHPWSVIRSGPWKLIKWYAIGVEPELYNLADDMSESNNLASIYPEKVSQLLEKLEIWYRHVGAKLPILKPEVAPLKTFIRLG